MGTRTRGERNTESSSMAAVTVFLLLASASAFQLAPALCSSKLSMRTRGQAVLKQSLSDIFQRFDKDGSGFLDKSELTAAFRAIDVTVSDAAIEHSFSIIDTECEL